MLQPGEIAEFMLTSIHIEEGEGFKFEIDSSKDSWLKSKDELKHNLL